LNIEGLLGVVPFRQKENWYLSRGKRVGVVENEEVKRKRNVKINNYFAQKNAKKILHARKFKYKTQR
jgi:hypothetical protein